MNKKYLYPTQISIRLPIALLCILVAFSQCKPVSTESFQAPQMQAAAALEKKHRGAHVFGSIDTANFQTFKRNNIEWITLVEWANQQDYDSPEVLKHKGDSAWIQKHNKHWVDRIERVRAAGFKVFLKPHIWIMNPSEGKWRSDIIQKTEEDWITWRESYRHYILRFAKIAARGQVEMFCIGTELSKISVERPLFWKKLIQEVREIYGGKITYGANWYEEFEQITFWEDLDYIGIQAYFPLVDHSYPSVEEVSKGWDKHLPLIESVHKKYKRNILFTEMGYKSTAGSAIKPWEWVEDPDMLDKDYSPETQANCYTAFFNKVWDKDWFAGVYIWQMRGDYRERPERKSTDFTPQGKPAEAIIAKGFE